MSRQALTIHPESRCAAVTSITADVTRSGRRLTLQYAASGAIAGLALPPPASSARADDLWKHSCFEAFARAEGEPGYFEFNFSPSTQWAAYAFDSYRAGMRPLDVAPRIQVKHAPDRFELAAIVDVPLPAEARWRVALSAVIEETSGAKSFWALAHPPGKPDFHHADAFALQI